MEPLFIYTREFVESIEQVDALLEEGHDMDSPEVQAVLQSMAAVDANFEQKAVRCGLYIRELRARADMARAEAQRLGRIAQAADKRAESLSAYVQNNMDALGKDKISDPLCPLSLRTSEAVEVADPSALPAQYRRIKYEADKASLKRDRPDVPGVSYVTRTHLRIGT